MKNIVVIVLIIFIFGCSSVQNNPQPIITHTSSPYVLPKNLFIVPAITDKNSFKVNNVMLTDLFINQSMAKISNVQLDLYNNAMINTAHGTMKVHLQKPNDNLLKWVDDNKLSEQIKAIKDNNIDTFKIKQDFINKDASDVSYILIPQLQSVSSNKYIDYISDSGLSSVLINVNIKFRFYIVNTNGQIMKQFIVTGYDGSSNLLLNPLHMPDDNLDVLINNAYNNLIHNILNLFNQQTVK